MKQLTKTDELIGKVIKNTSGLASEDEEIIITFNDSTFVILNVLRWGDAVGIGLDEDPIEPYLAKKAGLITKEKFDKLMAEATEKWEARQKETDIKQLERLMKKFPDIIKAYVAEKVICQS